MFSIKKATEGHHDILCPAFAINLFARHLKACFSYCRFPSLTSLDLGRACLSYPETEVHQKPWAMPALKELQLDTIELHPFWLGFIATSLTGLTQLTFTSCWLEEALELFDGDVDIVAANSVRCISWRQLGMGDCVSVHFCIYSSCIKELIKPSTNNSVTCLSRPVLLASHCLSAKFRRLAFWLAPRQERLRTLNSFYLLRGARL